LNVVVPEGSVTAVVGPNGAGKSTFLNMIAGLIEPTVGSLLLLKDDVPGSRSALAQVAFVAQDAPLYERLSVEDTLRLVRHLNGSWDQASAVARLAGLGIQLRAKVGHLSGGQKSQLALTCALARHPRILVLDEPVARLDPIARYDFMGSVMESVADDGISVLISSHVISELERIADHLIVLNKSICALSGNIDELLAEHRSVTGPSADVRKYFRTLDARDARSAGEMTSGLVRIGSSQPGVPDGWRITPVGLEELVLAYLRESQPQAPGVEASPHLGVVR
jgi:ABC-2 type transport system ATP-binding protein